MPGFCHTMPAVGFTRVLARVSVGQSARSPPLRPRLPALGILPTMDRQHHELIVRLSEVHSVGKPLQHGASGLIANGWERGRSLDHSRQHSLEVVDEPVAKPAHPSLVPRLRLQHLGRGLRPEDDGQRHSAPELTEKRFPREGRFGIGKVFGPTPIQFLEEGPIDREGRLAFVVREALPECDSQVGSSTGRERQKL